MVDQPEDVAPVIEAFLSEAEHRRSLPRTRVTRS
jgi:hypothetical protein